MVFRLNLLLILIIYIHCANGQKILAKEQLLANDDVLWSMEVYNDIHFYTEAEVDKSNIKRLVSEYSDYYTNSFSYVLKYSIPKPENQFLHKHYNIQLAEIIWNQRLTHTLYKDPELSQVFSQDELSRLGERKDTIKTFDPVTFDPQTITATRKLCTKDLDLIRIRQYIFYSKATGQFHSYPISAAVLRTDYDSTGNVHGHTPLFWFPINTIEQFPDLSTSNISWAARAHNKYSLLKGKVIKETISKKEVFEHMVENIKNHSSNIYHIFDRNDFTQYRKKVSDLELDEISSYRLNKYRQLNSLKFTQVFAWNTKTGTLELYIENVCPLLYLAARQHPFNKPLYYYFFH